MCVSSTNLDDFTVIGEERDFTVPFLHTSPARPRTGTAAAAVIPVWAQLYHRLPTIRHGENRLFWNQSRRVIITVAEKNSSPVLKKYLL